MSDATFNNPSPQFGTAEYHETPGSDHCQFCHQPIAGTYYRVDEALSCPPCAENARAELSRDTHAAYVRALLFGVGAAIVGLILYATFTIATGIIIGYASLAVGWMVGTAIMKGSGGVGGRRYQIAAALLTYAAVSMAEVPIQIHYAMTHKDELKQPAPGAESASETSSIQQSSSASASSTSASGTLASGTSASDEEFERQEQKANPDYRPVPPSRGALLGKLVLLGVASPFIELWEGGPGFGWVIGIVILVVGIRIAWRITAGSPLQIYGPFENSQPAP